MEGVEVKRAEKCQPEQETQWDEIGFHYHLSHPIEAQTQGTSLFTLLNIIMAKV